MPSLIDLRRRIRAVKSTQQITKAMKMIAASRLKRAQDRVVAARPFAQRMLMVLNGLVRRVEEDSHPLLRVPDKDGRPLLIVITGDRGLSGSFNSNVIKAAGQFIVNEGRDREIALGLIGRKGRDFFRRRDTRIVGEYIGLTGKGRVTYAESLELANDIMGRFREDETIDKVFVIFNEFKSALQQRVVVEQILPVARVEEAAAEDDAQPAQAEAMIEYIYEQPPAEIFGRLLPRLVETRVFRALLESIASEQGARMTAMDSASKNAGELIGSLTLNMNRIRQAAITKEIIEVVSGAAAAGS